MVPRSDYVEASMVEVVVIKMHLHFISSVLQDFCLHFITEPPTSMVSLLRRSMMHRSLLGICCLGRIPAHRPPVLWIIRDTVLP